jgi:hypothetical protein
MSLRDEVEAFLNDFKQKARFFDIVFHPRDKNNEALLTLGITAKQREEIVMGLTVENYYKGPTDDIDPNRPEYYEFGISIKSREIYIKLSLGKFNKSPHCMSFHIAEHNLDYPLKENRDGSK